MTANLPAFDSGDLRRCMRHWPSGVAIATTADGAERHGMTVNSFTSVSIDPPLISLAMAVVTRTYQLTCRSGVFGITILSQDQADVSNRFAGRETEQHDRFEGYQTFTLVTGTPLLSDGLAQLDCQVVEMIPAGVNMVVIGRVVAARSQAEPGQPLVYFNRSYRRMEE